MTIYRLVITDTELNEPFGIGIFSSENHAREVADMYLTTVAGFKDYPCRSEITAIDIPGDPRDVFVVFGWDTDDDGKDINIIEHYHPTREAAQEDLDELKKIHERTEWCIDRYTVDKANWNEGFKRWKY